MTARATVQNLLHRLADAAPAAWRHDPVFRGAAVAAGVTLALFLLRVAGPHSPELDPPTTTLRYVPGVGVQTIGPSISGVPAAPMPPADVLKIAPGHSLSDVTVAPTPGADRFGTFKPGKAP